MMRPEPTFGQNEKQSGFVPQLTLAAMSVAVGVFSWSDEMNVPEYDDEEDSEDAEQWSQGFFFETGIARKFHESKSQQQEALAILRRRKLTKRSFEQDWMKNGCRLAPAIDILRNGWGFSIEGTGSSKNPYWLLDPNQSPTKVRATDEIKNAYYESEHWVSMRDKRFQHDNYRCVMCVGSCRDEIQCHHALYNLYHEKLDELITVCRYHHELIHSGGYIKFPTGIDLCIAERLLGVVAYPFEEWLLP